MRKKLDFKDFQSVIEVFIEESETHYRCTVAGDYRNGNKSADTLFKIWRAIKEDKIDGKEFIDVLIDSKLFDSKSWIAAIALDMHYQVDKALEVLESEASFSVEPTVRFNAKMTIKTWKEQGWLYKPK